jgi:G3E family GTPase
MTQDISSIPVNVIAGYLGSGKTTLLNSVLAAAQEPIAVVVNDFGEVNIDAQLISARHDDVIELTNGCICCAVGTSLADVLFTILDRDELPSQIVIEASGVADPASVVAFTHMRGIHNAGTVVLVDAFQGLTTMNDTYVGKVFARQIVSADLLALTKCDIASPSDQAQLQAALGVLAPSTPVVLASPLVLSEILQVNTHTVIQDDHRSRFVSQRVMTPLFDDENDVVQYIRSLSSSVVRAKGIVELRNGEHRLVQLVGVHLSVTRTPLNSTGIVTISIGT